MSIIQQPSLYKRINAFKNSLTKPSDILFDLSDDEDMNDSSENNLEEQVLKFYNDNMSKRPSEICQLSVLMREYGISFEKYKPYNIIYDNYHEFKFSNSDRLINVIEAVKSYCHTLVKDVIINGESEKFYYGDIFFGYVIENVITAYISQAFNKDNEATLMDISKLQYDEEQYGILYDMYIKDQSFIHYMFFKEYINESNEINDLLTENQFVLIIHHLNKALKENRYYSPKLFAGDFSVSVIYSLWSLVSQNDLTPDNHFEYQHTDGLNGLIDVYVPEMIIDIKTTSEKPRMICAEDNLNLPANVVSCKDQLSIYASRLSENNYETPRVIAMINPVMNTVCYWTKSIQ